MYLRHTVLNRTKRSFYYQLTAYSRHSSNKLRNVLRRTSLKVFMFHNDFPVQPCVCWSRRLYKEELNIIWLAIWIRPSLANTRTEQERLICRDNSKCKNLERSELPLLSHVEELECNVLMHVNYSNAFCLTNCAGKTGQRFEHFRYR